MLCYKGKEYCQFDDCNKWDTCDRAFTAEVKQAAEKWWGNADTPVSFRTERHECFEEKTKLKEQQEVLALAKLNAFKDEDDCPIDRSKYCFKEGVRCAHYKDTWLNEEKFYCDCALGYEPEVNLVERNPNEPILGGHEYNLPHGMLGLTTGG